MIEAHSLTKHYDDAVAVDGIDLVVRPGYVTGFLGPNGAGKSTTMRMILGLDRPTSGTVTVNGRSYTELAAPLREVGALLEANALHPGRTARHHLRQLATSNRIPASRVDEVLDLVGLSDVADRRAGTFSLGMGQRLGIAGALIGDPAVVVLDEPVNGLDPEGIRWVRSLARRLADEGRTVFISSHLMSEMALMADHLVVVGRGRILADCSMEQFMQDHATSTVRVRTPDPAAAAHALPRAELAREGDALVVRGMGAAEIGDALFGAGVRVHELAPQRSSLEDAFMTLTADAVQFHTASHTPEDVPA
ncbi:ATP-binding cassette domain-containing protein [Aeromicrobium sp. 636]|uniref:ABC transporter ATP-binding protein n=1 Tax=Aeromicrobium senzhongii TaxID=2663859 RepID=A0A8I0K1K9_9ACTN|nr:MULTISPECIES: ABC transporter ATP-binding protein [Aeromicrobium]MBC9227661.1 ABC transporter ATP-binding protein [Aeromicrobium senzhongii]MCQ3999758.1 ATP-binding cassette domain-containing protein [Aeromicrobium sp. 636]